jgi:hypothetical protein
MTLTTEDLRAEAIAEAERLKRARAFIVEGDDSALARLEVSGTWIARSRKARLRRGLAGRVCLVWRVVFEDPSGRVVESMLLPMLVDVKRGATLYSPHWIESFLGQADDLLRSRIDVECKAWQAGVTQLVNASVSVRASRQRAIAEQTHRRRGDSQPGLFDRRAEREQRTCAAAAAEIERAAASRLQAILESARIDLRPAQLLLVLLP